ncbi:MAG: polysaccharide pyruvyl transferase family protein [Trichormus sp. ATA11-4-KO1]|jgi:pyruvyl transferase EpsO|nr:polysaccharide pyruvyl transferase family protein [Trichormus sp. ATA11-4-KO1]
MTISSPEKITEYLHQALGQIDSFKSCALLDYPDHPNIGDHLIWLGGVIYLTNVMKTQIKYAASIHDFSPKTLEEQIGKSPIVFHGGGSLGDLWTEHQKFREEIIVKYRDRPIIILPQSVYFKKDANLKTAAQIFNSHPNLTIFIRDNRSYKIASEAFDKCTIIKAPDIAFQMTNLPKISYIKSVKSSILYHCRKDKEINQQQLNNNTFELPNLVVEDWISYQWKIGHPTKKLTQSVATVYREVWQRGLATPTEWISRQKWQNSHPDSVSFSKLYRPSMHQRSLNFMHSGIYQIQQHRLVITNRLHGHILCLLLKKPHILLPNSYYKSEAFYETWTKDIPFSKFVKDTSQVKNAIQEILVSIQL